MPQSELEGKEYQKPEISAEGRAFLEARARRKRARGEDLPPIYQVLLGAPAPQMNRSPEPQAVETSPPEPGAASEPGDRGPKALQALLDSLPPTREELQAHPPPPERMGNPLELADHLLARGEAEGTLPPSRSGSGGCTASSWPWGWSAWPGPWARGGPCPGT
jgi:hypothetical protein